MHYRNHLYFFYATYMYRRAHSRTLTSTFVFSEWNKINDSPLYMDWLVYMERQPKNGAPYFLSGRYIN